MACGRVQLVLAVLAVGHTSAAGSKGNHSISRVDPIFGLVTPSQDIQDFLASVARKNSKEENRNIQRDSKDSVKDSGEDLRPKDSENQANMGFELYWPGGEWVVKKAAIDYCNTSDAACPIMYKRYGPVCAASSDMHARHTFENMCELADVNCRDGTASLMTVSNYAVYVRWFPVKRNSSIIIKMSFRDVMHVTLTRGKSLKYEPQFTFFYGTGVLGYDMVFKRNWEDEGWLAYERFFPQSRDTIPKNRVRTFRLEWNEDKGYVTWTFLDINANGERNQKAIFPPDWESQQKHKFPVRYIGVWGGTKLEPQWYELDGYLTAYRGRCREDLPTLPPDVPGRMDDRHKIQLFNFAERMDLFGYNFSRINGSIPNEYGGDYFSDYHALP